MAEIIFSLVNFPKSLKKFFEKEYPILSGLFRVPPAYIIMAKINNRINKMQATRGSLIRNKCLGRIIMNYDYGLTFI